MLRRSRFAVPCSHPHPSTWGVPARLTGGVLLIRSEARPASQDLALTPVFTDGERPLD